MIRLATLLVTIIAAAIFGYFVPAEAIQKSTASIITALSIVTAAVFVRLNRGMPSLDWKMIPTISRMRLTEGILSITKEYAVIILINSIFLIFALVMVGMGSDYLGKLLPIQRQVISSLSGALVGLSFSRMAYVVWRDYDIVKLQKHVIDSSIGQENLVLETKSAVDIVGKMGASNLRIQPRIQPKGWSE